jgi:ribosome hibernation promoting factor
MNLELHFRNSDFAEALETYLERRLQFALGPFAGQVGLVTVRLADSEGRRGRPQKQCEITAETAASGKVVAAENNADLYVAVDRAVRRLVRQLQRTIDRERRPGPSAGACFRRQAGGAPWTGFTQGGVYAGAEV